MQSLPGKFVISDYLIGRNLSRHHFPLTFYEWSVYFTLEFLGRGQMAKEKSSLLQGTLAMLILKTLTAGSMHGYEIASRIQRASGDLLKVEEGSLYPALYRMEAQGWIKANWGASENNRRAKYYTLTRAGRGQLAVEASNWDRHREAITRVMQPA
jgi:transcriptional regulator